MAFSTLNHLLGAHRSTPSLLPLYPPTYHEPAVTTTTEPADSVMALCAISEPTGLEQKEIHHFGYCPRRRRIL